MAHQLYTNKDGKVSFAFTGPREAVWHGLGQNLTEGADLETWKIEAGMDWTALESQILYRAHNHPLSEFPGRKVLYRSDTGEGLSVVSSEYNIVQPGEVIEFFRDLTESHGMKLSSAGCLFKGTRFWALAETGNEYQPIKGDSIIGHLLFVTSIDGSLSNTAKFVSTRVVCQNTLTVALGEKSTPIVRKTHRKVWDPTEVKINLGLLNSNWESFKNKLDALANHQMTDDEVKLFFKKTFFDPKKDEDHQTSGDRKCVNNLMSLYMGGAGAEYDYGTALGALNAVTNLFTHGTGRVRSADRMFWNAYFDDGAKLNTMDRLLELC